MKRRTIVIVCWGFFFLILASLLFYGHQLLKAPNVLVDKENQYLLIQNSDFNTLKDSLYQRDLLQDPGAFDMVAKLLDYEENVKPGRYLLKKDMTNLEAVRLLRSGNQTPVNITFNNVRLISDLSEKICQDIQLPAAEFERLLQDPAIIEKYGFNTASIMNMFIPNTYEVYWTIEGTALLEKMHDEYQRFWTAERRQKAETLNLSIGEVSTLASIVQAEQLGHPDERPRIAGLYLNRLKKAMKMDSDPALIFALGDFTIKRVLDKDKEIDSPYNTYLNKGLPPGPITLPSINSIDAVLNYQAHDYLFMCAKEDFSGYHNFAVNISQHLRNARLYQRELNRLKVYR